MSSKPRPIICTLSDDSAADQAQEWRDLRQRATSVEARDGGVRLVFPAEVEATVADLARREAACCAFLDLAWEGVDGEVVLDVTSDDPEALPVIALLAGIPLA